MKITLFVIYFVFIFDKFGSGHWHLHNPLKIISNAAEEVKHRVKNVRSEFASHVKEVSHFTNHVIQVKKRLLGDVNKDVFYIGKELIKSIDEVVGMHVELNEVTFWLVTSKNINNPIEINFYKPEEAANTAGKIFFIIHGWQSSRNMSWYYYLTTSLITRYPDAHVVQVNWDGPASANYALAAFDTEGVGYFVAILINRLVKECKVPKDDIVLIGHSLGGQISGWAAKKFAEITGEKLSRIIALDPAGPLFSLRPDTKRLNKHDAEVVMVVHTDGDKLGFPHACGTIDFFPNGGETQPGCWSVDLSEVSSVVEPVTCDHNRAWEFFIEAVTFRGTFPSRRCSSFNHFLNDTCENVIAVMGDLGTKLQGSFYLETYPQVPYSKPLLKILS